MIYDIHDPTFSKANNLFVLSFKNGNKNDRTPFSKCYTPKVQIKDFNVLLGEKSFFDVSIKNKEETFKKNIELNK